MSLKSGGGVYSRWEFNAQLSLVISPHTDSFILLPENHDGSVAFSTNIQKTPGWPNLQCLIPYLDRK